jgi:hypothetical protein
VAPRSTSRRAAFHWPKATALSSGVPPPMTAPGASMSAPASSSASRTSTSSLLAAQCSGVSVWGPVNRLLMSAPAAVSAATGGGAVGIVPGPVGGHVQERARQPLGARVLRSAAESGGPLGARVLRSAAESGGGEVGMVGEQALEFGNVAGVDGLGCGHGEGVVGGDGRHLARRVSPALASIRSIGPERRAPDLIVTAQEDVGDRGHLAPAGPAHGSQDHGGAVEDERRSGGRRQCEQHRRDRDVDDVGNRARNGVAPTRARRPRTIVIRPGRAMRPRAASDQWGSRQNAARASSAVPTTTRALAPIGPIRPQAASR